MNVGGEVYFSEFCVEDSLASSSTEVAFTPLRVDQYVPDTPDQRSSTASDGEGLNSRWRTWMKEKQQVFFTKFGTGSSPFPLDLRNLFEESDSPELGRPGAADRRESADFDKTGGGTERPGSPLFYGANFATDRGPAADQNPNKPQEGPESGNMNNSQQDQDPKHDCSDKRAGHCGNPGDSVPGREEAEDRWHHPWCHRHEGVATGRDYDDFFPKGSNAHSLYSQHPQVMWGVHLEACNMVMSMPAVRKMIPAQMSSLMGDPNIVFQQPEPGNFSEQEPEHGRSRGKATEGSAPPEFHRTSQTAHASSDRRPGDQSRVPEFSRRQTTDQFHSKLYPDSHGVTEEQEYEALLARLHVAKGTGGANRF